MQEIAPNIYIETGLPGVTLGAINWRHGLLMIDSPLRPDDIRYWRATLANMVGGMERLLINLDEHYDRTLGARQMECMVVGHEKLNTLFKDRPVTFKTQAQETGAEWELQLGLGSIRWAPPDISFSHALSIYWDADPILMEAHAGPSFCSIWVDLPAQKIIFIGDTVIADAPPFFSHADLPAWKESLNLLLSPKYHDYLFVSGRSGMVTHHQVKSQLKFFEKVEHQLEKIREKDNSLLEIERACHHLVKNFDVKAAVEEHYYLRMYNGLQQYLKLHAESLTRSVN
jgi:hypothetical protein